MNKHEYLMLLLKSAKDGTFPSTRQGWCSYRGYGKKKCPIGLLIRDEDYTSEMEGLTVEWINSLYLIIPDGLSILELGNIQRAHDGVANKEDFHREFVLRLRNLICFSDLESRKILTPKLESLDTEKTP